MRRADKVSYARAMVSCALAVGGAQVCAEESWVRLSGFVDISVERLAQSGKGGSVYRVSSGQLSSSRINFSGQEVLSSDLKAIFTYEPQFSADTGTAAAQARQSFVGLHSNKYGVLTMGRQNTPSYWIAGYADPSFSADYSMVSNMQFFYAAYRVDNAIQYNTPRFYGFMGRFMVTTGLEDTTRAGRYLSTGIEYRDDKLYAGFVSDLRYTRNINNAGSVPSARDNYASLAYKFGDFEPTLVYHTYNGYYAYPPYADFQSKGWDIQIGARYKLNPSNRLYASFVHRKDDNIHVEVPVTLKEAMLGARIEVPTISGPVAMTIPKGSNTGQTLRLRDKGIRNRKTGQRGHQLITLKAVLPSAEEHELVAFLENWQPKHPDHPRKEMLA